jgi:hypothetical protein
MLKKILLILLLLFVAIQFFRPTDNHSSTLSDNDITKHFVVPDTVLHILTRSCYDCHSNNTVYPWYDRIQPVAWWLNSHVRGGKRELNFSEFAANPPNRQQKKLKGIAQEIRKGDMPLDSYLWIHTYARLSATEQTLVIDWADSLELQIGHPQINPNPSH